MSGPAVLSTMLRLGFAFFLLSRPLAEAQHPDTPPLPAIEFVESVPVETMLDDPQIRNAAGVWLELIGGARKSLDIEQFYISNRPATALDTVIGAIESAAARGVRVRVIVDSRMYRTYPETADRLGKLDNIQVRVIDFGKTAGGVQHAKFFLVDGETVFLGSQNFDWRALTHIRELGLAIRNGTLTGAYARIFETDWALAGGARRDSPAPLPGKPLAGFPLALILSTGDTALVTPTWSPAGLIPDSLLSDERQILRLIEGARREVACQFLAYSTEARGRAPYRVLDDALRRAAARGASVKLIVADWEKATAGERSLRELSAVPGVQIRFSVIPEWSGGYVSYARVEHCKYIVVDGERFWLGTSNAERNYFHASRNIGAVIESHTLATQLRRFFMTGWEGPYLEPVTPEGDTKPRKHEGE